MDKAQLMDVIVQHQEIFAEIPEDTIEREIDLHKYMRGKEIVIITGIRRSGKSTVLKLLADQYQRRDENILFINFEDIRLLDITTDNYHDIENIAIELFSRKKKTVFFFDEIQYAPQWERWVNNLHFKGHKVFVTGSNAKILGGEIATALTGRNVVLALHPFSFREYLRLKGIEIPPFHLLTSDRSAEIFHYFKEYIEYGGFPEVLKEKNIELSGYYFNDILKRDIENRYAVREQAGLARLATYLASNASSKFTYSTLLSVTGLKSTNTISQYIGYFRDSYLFYTLPAFYFSLKKQAQASKKVYAGDNSFLNTVSFRFSENTGQKLENLVFLHLLQAKKGYSLFYHSGVSEKECDFLIMKEPSVLSAIQVSAEIQNSETKKRDIHGLLDALHEYNLPKGYILTMDRSGHEEIDGKDLIITPAWKYMLYPDLYP
ncbi:putative AAA+ superfamily ATPase [Methanocalculus alkaliphilus]|uniref:ATP-binding protein n=1 Tax=Methanocalculus alkaliphilus TaxID=768730 RepID=UPI00209CA309|nr:ATP-binding protein [Methanocalculus alkaliphilus]MCP1715603.1 putative AAA+ superfamily ATPase [Methanocalculus alkaliphilus]